MRSRNHALVVPEGGMFNFEISTQYLNKCTSYTRLKKLKIVKLKKEKKA